MDIDALLKKRGLKFEELEPEEQETLNTWLDALNRSQINVPTIKEYISKMKDSVGHGLSELNETPNDWLSIAAFFIPFVGIVRKWYLDQKRLALTARLRNYILLESFLSSPEKAKKAIENAIAGMQPKQSL